MSIHEKPLDNRRHQSDPILRVAGAGINKIKRERRLCALGVVYTRVSFELNVTAGFQQSYGEKRLEPILR